ncbi:MAG: ATP-dependent helicase [archaeon]|nr:ATP-dependent helicase [archaeon]
MAIEFQKEKFSDKEIFAELNPLVSDWFKAKFKAFTEPQRYAVLNVHRQENTLITAVTGSGKTLSAFTAVLNELVSLSEANMLENRTYCVYISPLKALNNDIEKNLKEPLEEITALAEKKGKKIEVKIGVRTGDTSTSDKAKMLKKAPHILITTPESIAILLNSTKFVELLKGVKWLIVDEIHALAGGKRGTHLSISLERLQQLSPDMCRIGLSATIAPIEEVAKFLVGNEKGKERPCKIVDVKLEKKLNLEVISPLPDLLNVSQKHLQESLYDMLDNMIQQHKTTLIFTNTRSATERVVHHLKENFPKNYAANIGAHHSSLSREHRLDIENRLKKGELKVVVSSTSLELGIDIGFIDLVILLGSPKSVARALQRVGRSGHKLHDEIKGRFIVMDRDDLVECSVLLKNALEHHIDRIQIPKNALDVLSQHIYGIAINEPTNADEVFRIVTQSYCYKDLKRSQFYEIIKYLAGEYVSLEARYVYAKIWYDEKTNMIGKKGKLARVIYMTNIGTIPDEARITVKIKDLKIGYIDEAFLEKLKRGDVFVLGGQSYEFRFAIGMSAQVVSAYKRAPTVPSWVSESLPLSFDLANSIGTFRKLMEQHFIAKKSKKEILAFIHKYLHVEENAANAIYEYFREQYYFLEIPHETKILVEVYKEANLTHIVFHTLYGRRVNDVLSRCMAYVASRMIHKDIELSMNDNGFVLTHDSILNVEKMISLVHSNELRKISEMAIERTEVLNRRFRHVAVRSLMILRSYKGRTKTAGRQQLASRLLIAAVRRISNDFPILQEARREVLEDLMDLPNAERVMKAIEEKKIKILIKHDDLPSPFAFNLIAQGHMDIMRMEDKMEFLKRLHIQVQERIARKEKV